MRHGEAGWTQDDFSRPLTVSGRRQVKILGNWMVEKNYIPSLTLYSSSVRTQETRSILGHILAVASDHQAIRMDSLYDSTRDSIRDTLCSMSPSPDILLIGHNPGLDDFVRWMCGVDTSSFDQLFVFNTGSVCVLQYALENNAIIFGSGHILDSMHP
jgi:phosphohistidine phosphatase